MCGLPGQGAASFLADVDEALDLGADELRLHPCLVTRGTALAGMHEQGTYRPWGLRRTVELCGLAVRRIWSAGARPIRLGLAPEPGLLEAVLAGPVHPAFGQMVRSRALLHVVRAHVALLDGSPRRLFIPRRAQGELLGQRKELAAAYDAMGLPATRIEVWPAPFFGLQAG
jgi:hypothetical protein